MRGNMATAGMAACFWRMTGNSTLSIPSAALAIDGGNMSRKANLYNIVTNDAMEYPLVCDIRGAAAVGEILGLTESQVWKYCCIGFPRCHKRKAVVIGQYGRRKSQSVYYKRWAKKHDRTEYFKRRWREKVKA